MYVRVVEQCSSTMKFYMQDVNEIHRLDQGLIVKLNENEKDRTLTY